MTDRQRALEAAILDDPDDPDTYLVYGDYLQAIGDPRGDLIALYAKRAAGHSPRDLSSAETALLAAQGPALLGAYAATYTDAIRWFYGFWLGLYVSRHASLAGAALDDHVAQLVSSPSARFVRELRCEGPFTPRVIEVAAPLSQTLRVLEVQLEPKAVFHDDDLQALAPLSRLRSLMLSSCAPVTVRGLAVLQGLRSIERLELDGLALGDPVAHAIAHLPLRDLRFRTSDPSLTAGGMRALAAAPLHRLRVGSEGRDDGITDALVVPFTGHSTLANVELYSARLTDVGAAALGSLPLRRLHLGSTSMTGLDAAGLAPLAGTLEALTFSHSEGLDDLACKTLASFGRLGFLDLCSTAITGAGLRELVGLRGLTELELSFLPLDDDDVAVLAALPNLRSLSLAYTQITDRAIETLLLLPQLVALDLGGTSITAAAIDKLSTLPELAYLGLSGCAEAAVERAYERPEWHVEPRELILISDLDHDD